MTQSALEKLLTTHDGRRDGDRVILESTATFLVRIGSQCMTIERVKSVELGEELCSLATGRGEVYAVHIEDVRGVRFEAPRSTTGIRPLG